MSNITDERGYHQIFRTTPAQVIRLQRRAAAMLREMRLPTDPAMRARIHILEIGCGTGELAAELARQTGARVTGVDLSARFIAQARSTHVSPNLSFAMVDLAREFPASDADRYEYIVGNGILHHLYHHLDDFLPILLRWLVPGGRLIFWEPNLRNPYVFFIFTFARLRRLAKLEPDEMAFTGRFICQKLNTAGFDQAEAAPRDFLLPNTPTSLIKPVIWGGSWIERVPLLRHLAQSLFIVARHPLGSADRS